MTAATDHSGITTTFSYDALGRRLSKSSGETTTLFGWDGDVLAFESTQSKSAIEEGGEHGWSMHYIHEASSFVPLVQVRRASAMALSETTDVKALMAGNGGRYDIEQDPLWNGEQSRTPAPFGKEEIAFYQCDHLGTPQELTDYEGRVAWSASYKAWERRGRRSVRWDERPASGIRFASKVSIWMKRRGCITTDIGTTTRRRGASHQRIRSG